MATSVVPARETIAAKTGTPIAIGRPLGTDGRIVIGLFSIALLLRLVALGTLPHTVMPDEVDFALHALKVRVGRGPGLFGLDSEFQPAFTVHLMALSMAVFGENVAAVRLPSALLGALTVAPVYYLARELVSRPAAFVATALFTVNLWPLHFARSGWDNTHTALWAACAGLALTRALSTRRYRYYALAGAFCALGLYGYFGGRLIFAGLLAFLPLAIYRSRDARRVLTGYALTLAVCVAVFLPQVPAIVQHWDRYVLRVANVSIVDPAAASRPESALIRSLAHEVESTIRGFVFLDGRVMNNHRYMPPNKPMFDMVTGTLFVIGLVIAAKRWRETGLWWCMGFLTLLATQGFSQGAPNPARAIATSPYLLLFTALPIEAALRHRRHWSPLAALAIIIGLPAAAYLNVGGYLTWMAQPSTHAVRQPAVLAEDFTEWVAVQRAEVSAGRYGLNAMEWTDRRATRPAASQAPPTSATPAALVAPPGLAPATAARVVPIEPDLVLSGAASGLQGPRGVAVSPSGAIFVADPPSKQVLRFDARGQLLGPLTASFEDPFDVAVSASGDLYVVDSGSGNVLRFDPNGVFVGALTEKPGTYRPRGLDVTPDGTVFVADTGRDRVIEIGTSGAMRALASPAGLKQPTDVAIGPGGALYVVYPESQRIVLLDRDGKVVWEVGLGKANTLDAPHLAAMPDGSVLVTDPPAKRALRISAAGKVMAAFEGSEPNALELPVGIAVDSSGHAVVADTRNAAIIRFRLGE